MPGRLLWALDARRRALPDSTITLIPCDNLDDNGSALRAVLGDLASLTSPLLGTWIDAQVDIVCTSVDRITPRTTTSDVDAVAARWDIRDEALVVTEPFRSWILSGRSRADRPRWEDAGAAFVSDIAPFEQRKLWMLNGAHSLLASAGIVRGHATVAEAIADPSCAALVHDLWDLAERRLDSSARQAGVDLDLPAYREALLDRFANPAIVHRLHQIVADSSLKLRARIIDPVRRARADGETGEAGIAAVAAWTRFVIAEVQAGRPLDDAAVTALGARAAQPEPQRALLDLLAPDLATEPSVLRMLAAHAA